MKLSLCTRSAIGMAISLIIIGACAFNSTAQKVTTTCDNAFDFKNAKRYAWGQNQIVQEVNRNLVAKGFIEDPTSPDFYISYDAGASDMAVGVEGAPTSHPPVSTTTIGPVYGIPQNVWYSVDGHITFHIVEAKSNKTVWTAAATKKIRDPHKGMKDMPKQVEQIVSKAFKRFPPSMK